MKREKKEKREKKMNKILMNCQIKQLLRRSFSSIKPIPSDLSSYDIVIVGEKYGVALANQIYYLTKGKYNILLVNEQS